MIPTIVEKQILNSLRTNKLKKQLTDENLPPPHRRLPFFLQTVTHAQKALTAHGPQIASKLRLQVSKLWSKNPCVPYEPPYIPAVFFILSWSFFSKNLLLEEKITCDISCITRKKNGSFCLASMYKQNETRSGCYLWLCAVCYEASPRVQLM